ncbi:hypothetical protein O4J56_20945 [Nocardiopsis sp. RSe5-2]|uniref:Uncharacterized protein n=1 Tax=Nocardiopsis endophytica TaxID=3018445 RepID=A0ABT4U840_9ACTN|nr:hypothetical protein [Nocardiopsis endophytica]MDA2813127.1 hypothetical protein [Nocardiopsis endophytica]
MDWPTAAIIITIILGVAFTVTVLGTTLMVRGRKEDDSKGGG